MDLLGPLILSTAIILNNNVGDTGNEKAAIKALGKASYKYSKLDKEMKKLQERYLNEKVIYYGGWTTQIAKVVIEKRITFEWRF